MKQKINLLFTAFLFHFILLGQNPDRLFIDYHFENNVLEINTNDGLYKIKAYTDEIVETAFIPTGEKYNDHSHAVILTQTEKVKCHSNKDHIVFATKKIKVLIYKSPFKIAYIKDGKEFLSEKRGFFISEKHKNIELNIGADDVLYGGGNRVLGMNRRGNKLELYNRAHYGYETHSELMNYTMPLFLSSKIFAVHFDNAPIGFLDLDSKENNTVVYETISGRLVYQVIATDDWDELIDQFTQLTGRQPLPPRWAFGNFSSRFGYHSEKETRETVQKFFDEGIPLDAVIIDIYWFGKDIFNHMGNLEFYRDSFPTPYKMMDDFKNQGVKTILVTEPFILTTSKKWNEAVYRKVLATDRYGKPKTWDFYFGNTGLIDIYKPYAEKWFWNIYKDFTEKGVGGWWGDLGEPEVHPSDTYHFTGKADEVHNIYGHDWARLIYEGYQRDFPDQRPFILMRAGYSGSQRYGLIPWTGDVSRSWGGLKPQPQLSLQMGMQGIAYMHSDLGGFAGGETFDPELYTRWLQYGVFQPLFRPHAQEHIASEPVFHDDKTKASAKKSIELRYNLLPYIYTIAFKNNQSGKVLMEPLFFNEKENKDLLTYDKAYLWGDDFLISPVTEPGITAQKVYFPKGNDWVDFYSNRTYVGGKEIPIDLKPDHIPTFVKSGSFIPLGDNIRHAGTYDLSTLKLLYFYKGPNSETESMIYHDDGETPQAYEKNAYEIMHLKATSKKNTLNIKIDPEIGEHYKTYHKEWTLIINKFYEPPKKVKVNGKKVAYERDDNAGKLMIPVYLFKDSQRVKIKF